MKTIGIVADHAGYELKGKVCDMLLDMGYAVRDFGTHTTDSVDYPDLAHPFAKAVAMKVVDLGVAVCGTGNGMAITLNKHPLVRAGLAWNAEIAALIRQHNDANVCALPARFITDDEAIAAVTAFVTASFEGGRHTERVRKIAKGFEK